MTFYSAHIEATNRTDDGPARRWMAGRRGGADLSFIIS